MSSLELSREHPPLIVLVHTANRAFQEEMVRQGRTQGFPEARQAHNAVFATLSVEGSRASDMAARAGITKQSMGEVVRELAGIGLLEMRPDPSDRRAKLVTYTKAGLEAARKGRGHLADLERRFIEEFGAEEYSVARRVLARVTEMLEEAREMAEPSAEPVAGQRS